MSKHLKDLKSAFKEITLEITEHHSKWVVIRTPTDSLRSIAQYVKETLGFDHAISVSVIDDFENKQFLIAYHLSSALNSKLYGVILSLEVIIPRNTPTLPSLVDIWPSVEFHEREGWEMFGVEFNGHPRLERLLLPESWEGGFPLRKDYKIGKESA